MTHSLITSKSKAAVPSIILVVLLIAGLINEYNHYQQVHANNASTFTVTVDYTRSLPEMIQAGKYGYANGDITAEHFPFKGEGKADLEIVLVHFDKNMASADVLAEFDKLGLRAATLPELLVFGKTHPDVQRQFPIIALGSSWRLVGRRYVPFLGLWVGKRWLGLDWFGSDWYGHCRFAAVRK